MRGGKHMRIAIHIDKGAGWAATGGSSTTGRERMSVRHHRAELLPGMGPRHPRPALGQHQPVRGALRKGLPRGGTGYGSHLPDNPCMVWPQTPEGRLQFMADIVNTVRKAPLGIGVMYWAPEWEAWNADGTPGPAVFVMDRLSELTARPASHAPAAVANFAQLGPEIEGPAPGRTISIEVTIRAHRAAPLVAGDDQPERGGVLRGVGRRPRRRQGEARGR